MPKRKTKKKFIEESINKHGDKYDYSLVEYVNSKTKVKIICKDHGVFEQRPNDHLDGNRCPLCHGTPKKTKDKIIKDFVKIHNNTYDYTLVNYKNTNEKIKIICHNHGIFEQNPHEHLKGQGCPKCVGKRRTLNELIILLKSKHGDKYDYGLIMETNTKNKVNIICPTHGKFNQHLYHHINGKGCPKCNESYGEKEVRIFLDNNNILYEYQKKFHNCKYIRHLKFDFYLPKYNICIEYDGEQHYKINEYFGGMKEFLKTQKRDKIKNEYCQNNNIRLIRINYNENINDKLSHFLF